jgi:hypothetical protein
MSDMRRGAALTCWERIAAVMRKIVPERLHDRIDGARPDQDGVLGADCGHRPGREEVRREVRPQTEAPDRAAAADPEAAMRKARIKALRRHAGAGGCHHCCT